MVVLLAFIPFFTWAFSDVFGTLASRKIGTIPVNFFFLLFSFLSVSLYAPFAVPLSSWFYFSTAFILGGIHVVGLLAYFKALEKGNSSLVGAIVGSFSVVVVTVSLIIFKETLHPLQAIGIILCLTGLLLTSFKLQELTQIRSKKLILDPGVRLAFITFIAWGLYFSLIRIPVEKIGWFWSLYPATFYFMPLIFIASIRQKVTRTKLNGKVLSQIIAMVLLGRTGDFTYNIALTIGYSSIVGAIAGISSVFFVILTRIIFKEKLDLQQKIGISSSLLGIVTIALATIV